MLQRVLAVSVVLWSCAQSEALGQLVLNYEWQVDPRSQPTPFFARGYEPLNHAVTDGFSGRVRRATHRVFSAGAEGAFPLQYTLQIKYERNGQRSSIEGTAPDAPRLVHEYTYEYEDNPVGKQRLMTQVVKSRAGDETQTATSKLSYDADGNVVEVETKLSDNRAGKLLFSYDDNGQLRKVVSKKRDLNGEKEWTYDGAGKLTLALGGSAPLQCEWTEARRARFIQAHDQPLAEQVTLQFDEHGSLVRWTIPGYHFGNGEFKRELVYNDHGDWTMMTLYAQRLDNHEWAQVQRIEREIVYWDE